MGRLSSGGVLHAGQHNTHSCTLRWFYRLTCSAHKVTHMHISAQSDREKSEGLPVAPFMDRDKVTKPTAQIGFIKFVLIPMFETVMKV